MILRIGVRMLFGPKGSMDDDDDDAEEEEDEGVKESLRMRSESPGWY